MYGKIFASTFSGSMVGAGPDVFAVWAFALAQVVNSRVELNPRLLAPVLGTTQDRVEAAIEYLGRPDADSRNPAEEGRRLIREGQYQYRVVSHEIYQAIRNEEERRNYNAQKKRESRDRLKNVKPDVIDGQ